MSRWDDKYIQVSELKGKVFSSAECFDDRIVFVEKDTNKHFVMRHDQDCCESVYIDDITGSLNFLVDSEILVAEESISGEPTLEQIADHEKNLAEYGYGTLDESFTWTFYKFATQKGYVDIRWYGSSNGYYSESVDLFEIDGNKDN